MLVNINWIAFDIISHDLIIAKFMAYGLSLSDLKLTLFY